MSKGREMVTCPRDMRWGHVPGTGGRDMPQGQEVGTCSRDICRDMPKGHEADTCSRDMRWEFVTGTVPLCQGRSHADSLLRRSRKMVKN